MTNKTTSPSGYAVIRAFEGRSLKSYRDEVGVWTIGYGQTNSDAAVLGFKVGPGVTITPEQCESLLETSVKRLYEPAVNTNMGAVVTQPAFDAGVSFHYNTGAIARASWVKSYVANNLPAVHSQLTQWNRAGGNVLAGLTRRRNREWEMISRGEYGPEGAQTVLTDERGRPIATAPSPAVPVGQPSPTPPTAPAPSDKPTTAAGVLKFPCTDAELGAQLLRIYRERGYRLDIGPDMIMIAYIEGWDTDNKPNQHRPDKWDDCRIVWQAFADGGTKILGKWTATTRAGKYYEQVHLLNPGGAFHIAIGQHIDKWQMGIYHHGNYEALLNVAPLLGTRDSHKNYLREGATIYEQTGAHHHWGYNFSAASIQTAGAGCLVGEFDAGHLEFISYCKMDKRWKANHGCLWSATVIPAAWVTGVQEAPSENVGTVGSLSIGNSGPEVADYQRLLIAAGYELDPDGIFGDATLKATLDYQHRHPQLVQTGIADRGTRLALSRTNDAKRKVTATTTASVAVEGSTAVVDKATAPVTHVDPTAGLPDVHAGMPGVVYIIIGVACAVALGYVAWQYRDEITVWFKGKFRPSPATPAPSAVAKG